MLAVSAQKKSRAVVLAGGTDFIVDRHLMPVEKAMAAAIDVVVDVTGVADFHRIEALPAPLDATAGDRWLRFGGGVTYWDLRCSHLVMGEIPMLGVMAKDVGAVQIQTRGTLAGNVASASPAADGVAAMLALEARLHLESVRGTRIIALEDALLSYRKTALEPGELIVAIDVRVPAAAPVVAHVRWRKVGTRLAQAISKVALASVIETKGDTVARAHFGMASVAATTHALAATRAFVVGKTLAAIDPNALDAAVATDIRPIDDVRSTGEYRLHVAQALVRQAVGIA